MKIAVFFPNYIGDILMATPALRFLKANCPGASIAAVVKESCGQLVDENPDVDTLILKSSKLKLFKDLAEWKPDAVVLFRTTFYNSLAAFVSGARFTAGTNDELANLLLKSAVPVDRKRPYRTECLLIARGFLSAVGISNPVSVDPARPQYAGWDRADVKKSVGFKLEKAGISASKKLITIAPAATRKTKMLDARGYSELLGLLKSKYPGHEIILAGSAGDADFCSALAASARVKSVAGDLNLKELGALISASEFFISPDTGPAYIAQAVGAKALTYFTSTAPDKYGPFPATTKIIYLPVSCSPCYKNECGSEAKYRCLQSVSPRGIADKTDELVL